MTAATRATTIPPTDALDPIITVTGEEEPIYLALADEWAKPCRDARGRFVARGRG